MWTNFINHCAINKLRKLSHRAFLAADLSCSEMRIDLPLVDSPEFRSLLFDLLTTVWERAVALKLPLDELGDPKTLASRLDNELDDNKSFASFVGLVGAVARTRFA